MGRQTVAGGPPGLERLSLHKGQGLGRGGAAMGPGRRVVRWHRVQALRRGWAPMALRKSPVNMAPRRRAATRVSPVPTAVAVPRRPSLALDKRRAGMEPTDM